MWFAHVERRRSETPTSITYQLYFRGASTLNTADAINGRPGASESASLGLDGRKLHQTSAIVWRRSMRPLGRRVLFRAGGRKISYPLNAVLTPVSTYFTPE